MEFLDFSHYLAEHLGVTSAEIPTKSYNAHSSRSLGDGAADKVIDLFAMIATVPEEIGAEGLYNDVLSRIRLADDDQLTLSDTQTYIDILSKEWENASLLYFSVIGMAFNILHRLKLGENLDHVHLPGDLPEGPTKIIVEPIYTAPAQPTDGLILASLICSMWLNWADAEIQRHLEKVSVNVPAKFVERFALITLSCCIETLFVARILDTQVVEDWIKRTGLTLDSPLTDINNAFNTNGFPYHA